MSTKVTNKRGEFYTVLDDRTVQISIENVALPSSVYSATWVDFQPRKDAVRFCFGQSFETTLISRVDVRVGAVQFLQLCRASPDFFKTLFQAPSPDPASWHVDSKVPGDRKALVEDATFVAMAYSGDQAEMNFYQVPPYDMWLVGRTTGHNEKYRGPRPVLTVVLLASQLRWLMEQAVIYAATLDAGEG